MTTSQKARMLRCASPFVVAAYAEVRLTPQGLRALPAELFTKPPLIQGFWYFLRGFDSIEGSWYDQGHCDGGRRKDGGADHQSDRGDGRDSPDGRRREKRASGDRR